MQNQRTNKKLPLFMHKLKDAEILREVISAIPKGTKVYLVGGQLRNAIFYLMFKKALPSRDFDIIVHGNFKEFEKNLCKKGYEYGKIRERGHVVVLKARVPKPKDRLKDHLFLELKHSKVKNIRDDLKKNANFTINSSALLLKNVLKDNWRDYVIATEATIQDLKRKRLVLNSHYPSNLFAALRFMSQGFSKPDREDVLQMTKDLKKMPPEKWTRNLDKLYAYVGGQKKARKILKSLGLSPKVLNPPR